jgi:hypothetical protein
MPLPLVSTLHCQTWHPYFSDQVDDTFYSGVEVIVSLIHTKYSKIPLSQTWFISNTPLISKSIAGPGRFHYINDLQNSWYLEHGYLEYPAYLEVYLWSQTLILPLLSRSAVKFLVCLTYLAALRHQFTPTAIYTHYNLFFLRHSLILRCPRPDISNTVISNILLISKYIYGPKP